MQGLLSIKLWGIIAVRLVNAIFPTVLVLLVFSLNEMRKSLLTNIAILFFRGIIESQIHEIMINPNQRVGSLQRTISELKRLFGKMTLISLSHNFLSWRS